MQEILWNLLSSSNFSFGFMKSIIHLFSVTLETKTMSILHFLCCIFCSVWPWKEKWLVFLYLFPQRVLTCSSSWSSSWKWWESCERVKQRCLHVVLLDLVQLARTSDFLLEQLLHPLVKHGLQEDHGDDDHDDFEVSFNSPAGQQIRSGCSSSSRRPCPRRPPWTNSPGSPRPPGEEGQLRKWKLW